MTLPNSENPTQAQREKALAEWEQHTSHSLLVGNSKKKIRMIALIVLVLLALGIVWVIKNSSADSKPISSNASEATIAERAPVPNLKEAEGVSSDSKANPPEKSTPLVEDTQQAQLDAQRQEQERRLLEARMKSAIMPVQQGGQSAPSVESPAYSELNHTHHAIDHQQPHHLGRSGNDTNSRFNETLSASTIATSQANRIDYLEYKILQGKLIEAVLEPRAISDLPGTLCATVQRDVIGTQGRLALIPWGSRVCGTYNAELRKGQDRLFVIWQTVRRPDGVQVALNSPGADQLGSSGMGGQVNTHFAQIFGVSALLSIIGAGSANISVNGQDAYNSVSYYRQSVQQAAAQTSQQVLQPYINIPPTVTVPAGSRIRIYVNRDLDFTAIYHDEIETNRQALEKKDIVMFIP